LSNLATITRANFLPLAVVIVIANLSAAFYSHQAFSLIGAVLVLIGSLLLHASVNAFNNYFDFRSMIDSRTVKTPFSGGVDILVKGKMKGSSALLVAVICLMLAAVIGTYFLLQFFSALLPIAVYGVLAIVFYTPVLSKIHGISEVVAGSGFGVMGLGTYVTQTGVVDQVSLAVFVPVSILVGLLLFLNEFPDAEVDRIGGRRHLVILLGKRRAAALYVIATTATYLSIIYAILAGVLPWTLMVALLTLPIAFKACRLVLQQYDNTQRLVPALGLNVIMILVTILLIGVGFLLVPFI